MAILIDLDIMLAKRKMKSKTLSELINITEQDLSILKTGKAKAVRLSTLNEICAALKCTPGDILRYEPDSNNNNENTNIVGSVECTVE